MTNNDILRRLRFAFDYSDQAAAKMFQLDPSCSVELSVKQFKNRLLKEDEAGYCECNDHELCAFLDGMIVSRRGLREPGKTPITITPATIRLSKNDVLKKLRIAMNFREEQMLGALKEGGSELSKAELSALFRNPKHKHYRTCGNQVLRAFIKGLTLQQRQ